MGKQKSMKTMQEINVIAKMLRAQSRPHNKSWTLRAECKINSYLYRFVVMHYILLFNAREKAGKQYVVNKTADMLIKAGRFILVLLAEQMNFASKTIRNSQ